jgi:hypothetical protein
MNEYAASSVILITLLAVLCREVFIEPMGSIAKIRLMNPKKNNGR